MENSNRTISARDKTDAVETVVAREVAAALKRNGVPYLFGILGGGSSIDLVEACREQEIPFVLVQHETSAAMMAVVCGELTDSCGVCVSIMATGAVNLAGGATYAYLERHPLLCISESYGAQMAPLMSIQKIDHAQTFASYCKDTIELHTDHPGRQIDEMIRLAMTERPGPVFVDFPHKPIPTGSRANEVQEALEPSSKIEGDLEAIADALKGGVKPIIIAGPVVLRQGAAAELIALADRLGSAVMVTSKARGVIPETHPLYAGVMSGVYKGETLEGRLMAKSDVVMAVGLDRMELLTPWKYEQPLLALDAVPVEDEIVGDPAYTATGPLADMLDSLRGILPDRTTWNPTEIEDFWEEAMRDLGASTTELNATSVLLRAREMAARDTILTTEAGVYGRVNLYAWKVYEPGTYFDSSGANTMGFSIPAALAAALLRPKGKTVSLVGDGGFLMRAGELETAARMGLSPTIIIFDDGSMGMIRIKQRSKGYAREGVDIAQIDFVRLAQSFGGVGSKVETIEEFENAFGQALESDRLHVIDVRLDADIYAAHIEPIRGV